MGLHGGKKKEQKKRISEKLLAWDFTGHAMEQPVELEEKLFVNLKNYFTKDIKECIQKGYIQTAIAQRAFGWGTMSLELLMDCFAGKKVTKYTDTGTYEVNKDNMNIYDNRI